jgi:hypothetical protein
MKYDQPLATTIKRIGIGLILILFVYGLLASTPSSAATTSFQVSSSSDDVNEDGAVFTTNATTVWIGSGSSATASFTGLRFTNITIPPGSTISSARLNLYSSQNQWIGLSMSIAGDLSPNSPTFSSASKPSQRTLTTNKVSHSSNISWSASTWYYLDEMAPVVQEIVSQPGWQSGNSLSIILKGTGRSYGRKMVRSWDGSSAYAAKLEISFTSGSGNTSTPTSSSMPTATGTPSPVPPTPTYTPTLPPGTFTATSTPVLPSQTQTVSSPTSTPGASPLPTSTLLPGSMLTFPVGPGGPDVIPHQIVRTANDRVYFFVVKGQYSPVLYAYWTSSPGLPNSGADFSGTASITDSANIISVDAAYDGANIIHILTNTTDRQIKDRAFDLTTNSFRPAKVLDTNGGTATDTSGTSGLSGMFDASGRLQLVYWTNANHILHRAYTYDSSSDTLTLVSGPTQLDASGSATHPVLAVSPLDGSITAAWVSQATSPAQILAKVQTAGSWGASQVVSSAPVWTDTGGGISVDQGPSLIITPDGVRHLAYIEDWRINSPYDYGRVHAVTNSGSGWIDQYIGSYAHDPAFATDNAGGLFIIGHGYPLNSSCTTADDMCVRTQNADGSWGAPVVLIAHQGNQSFDSSPSVKWSVVGYNRPDTVEFLFSEVGIGGYTNPVIYYGRINSSGLSIPVATQIAVASPTSTVTPVPTSTVPASGTPTPLPPTRTLTSIPTATATSQPGATATTTGGTPLYVQSWLAYSANFASSQAVTLPGAVTAGHAIVVAVSAYSYSTAGIGGITDSAGNVYVKAVQSPNPTSGNHALSIWYALNVKGIASLTVTASAPSGNPEYITLAAHEYSGISSVSALDQTAGAQGSGLAATSGSTPAATQASELVLGVFLHEQDSANSPTASTAAAGFSLRQSLYDGQYEPLVTEDETVNQIGAYAAGLTWNKTANWLGAAVTLKGG